MLLSYDVTSFLGFPGVCVCVCQFLQVENEFAREQMGESERTLRANLQSLRERNIQCEDLKGELGRLQ